VYSAVTSDTGPLQPDGLGGCCGQLLCRDIGRDRRRFAALGFPGNGDHSGDAIGRLGSNYFTINTRILGNPTVIWPLLSAPPLSWELRRTLERQVPRFRPDGCPAIQPEPVSLGQGAIALKG